VISGGFGVSDGEIGADDVGGAGVVVVVVTGADGVVGGADDVGGAGVVVVVTGVVTGATGVVAGTEGDGLVGGASFVGV